MPNSTALIVIDAQVTMFHPSNPVFDSMNVLKKLKSLIQAARAKQIPVIFVQHSEPGDPEFEPGSERWQIHPELRPENGELVIEKFEPDAFRATQFKQELESRGIRNLILVGMQSEYCIVTNSHKAKDLGFDVTLVRDAHSTFDEQQVSRINQALENVVRLVRSCDAV